MSRVRVTYPALSREQVTERLRQAYVKLAMRLPVSRIFLYGSYAQGRYTAGSDIDVIVVYEGKRREDAYRIVIEEVCLPRLEPRVYTEQEFEALMLQSPKFAQTLHSEGVLIFGTAQRDPKWSREAETG